MDEKTREKISALVDGEISNHDMHELINDLRTNPGHLECWQNYHLISDALSNNLSNPVNSNLANRVSQALESEPTLLNPPASSPTSRHTTFTKPLVGFALAASVAGIAFLGMDRSSEMVDTTLALQQQELPAEIATSPVAMADSSSRTEPYQVVKGTRWEGGQPAMDSRLNDYLLSHDELTAYAGAQSAILPHVRIVGYEPAQAVR